MSAPSSLEAGALQVRGSRASTVIVHHVPPEREHEFLASERDITKAASKFPGYQTTEIYPASAGTRDWVVIVHFDDQASLQKWIDSPARQECIDRLDKEVGQFELRVLPSGFGGWFAGLAVSPKDKPTPGWKMAATVLLCLYPIVMLLAIFIGPYTSPMGMALSMLVGNIMSISILQWLVMPVATNLLAPWLKANEDNQRAFSIGGLIGVLALTFCIALVFRLVTS